MNKLIQRALQIRYVKLHFTIEFAEDTIMPRYKASAIRGGIGEMLLQSNCIRNRDCSKCDFESECIVQRTMYSKFDIEPSFRTEGESIGFTLDCNCKKENFCQGERMTFQLTLFGKTIVYFSQYLQAIYTLGRTGIGKYHSRFHVVEVYNSKKQLLVDEMNVYMHNYVVETLEEYVKYRMNRLEQKDGDYFLIRFDNPMTIKYQGEFLQEFEAEPIIRAVKRRIYMLDCFENIGDVDVREADYECPVLEQQQSYSETVPRFSSRQKQSMTLKGIRGNMVLRSLEPDVLTLLLAGEIAHIGKNTRFGFGGYYIKKVWQDEI